MTGVDFNSVVGAGAAALAAAQVILICREAHRRKLAERLDPVLTGEFDPLTTQFLRNDPFDIPISGSKTLKELGPWICVIHDGAEACSHRACWANTLPAARHHEARQVMMRFKCLHALAIPPIESSRAARAINLPERLMTAHAFDRAYAALGIPPN